MRTLSFEPECRIFNRTIFVIMTIFCAYSSFFGQYRFDSWTTDDGLPQNSVYSILQTADGYIWFTTLDGLVRFDGIKFKVLNRGNSNGLATNRLVSLLAEDDNSLWVGTEDSGLYHVIDGKFQSYPTSDGLPLNRVTKLVHDPEGNLLAFSQSGLARFDGNRFVRDNNLDGREFALMFTRSGVRWEANEDGLFSTKNGVISKFELPFQPDQISAVRTFNYPGYIQIIEDRIHSGVLWLTGGGNLFRFENGVFKAVSSAGDMPKSVVRSIVQDETGMIWLGTEEDGLCNFDGSRIKCFTTSDGLSNNRVGKLFIDREKTLWAATNERGINRVSLKPIAPLSIKEGLIDRNIYPILEDSKGNYWIGASNALSLYSDGKVKNFTRKNGLLYEIVQSLFEDKEGKIWIGSLGGVEYFENGKFVDFTEKLGLTVGDFDFWNITQTSDGTMWFATSQGLLKFDDGIVTKFTIEDGLPSKDVKQILQAKDGTIWIATVAGLARFVGESIESFTEKDGLSGNHIRMVYEDSEGLLWVGTYDAGLTLYRNGAFATIKIEDGLFSNGVFQILPDEKGNFWISSNQGIYRVNRQQLIDFADGRIPSIISTAFGKSDGMLNVECNGGRHPAGIKSSDGKLWFPTQDGVAIVDPEMVGFNPLPPPVVIENITIDNQPVSNFQSNIEIHPGQENLEIEYTGLSFIKPEQIRFRYKLDGLDKDWTEAGERRTAYFPHLPPGNYVFHVSAANSDNVWNQKGATIEIVVHPAFYQTWWFAVLCCLIVAAVVYWLYQRRLFEVERKQAAQEDFSRRLIAAHESERRRVAGELHDSLGQTLAMIKNRAEFAVQNAKDVESAKEEFDQITDQSVSAINEVREISYNLRPYLLDRLGLTKALKSLFGKTSESSGLKFETNLDNIDDLFAKDEEMSIYRIVQESLSNILKHAEANAVAIEIKKSDRFVSIKIQDDGKGFSNDGSVNSNKKPGFGLLGIAERVKLLGGTHTIESVLGKGTSVIIKLKKSEPPAVAGG